ncbi:MAG: nucleoside-diphosphate sugar epimerase/dehydratase [bacterium]|nr:nucleoside-diphosphate sugar epimerase/dehydratase [bacterium]
MKIATKGLNWMTLVDTGIGVVAYYLAFVLRFSTFSLGHQFTLFLQTLLIVVLIKFVIFSFFEVNRGISKYISIEDLVSIFKATSFSTIAITIVMFTVFPGYPRSIPMIDWCLTIVMVGGFKIIPRVYSEFVKVSSPSLKRILIVGAGDAGTMILREIKNNSALPYKVIGFIDDEKAKQGRTIQGVPVIGTRYDIQHFVRRYKIGEVIIAIPSAPGNELRNIVMECKKAKVTFKTVPSLSEVITDTVSLSQLKEVDVEDLLRRLPIKLDTSLVSLHISGKKIMVTGAAGSIGSELCRQIGKFNPEELILVDMAETPLFHIERSLRKNFPGLTITPFLIDIKDKYQVEQVIQLKPDIIYHAAAYKHVPLLERNWSAAIKNNIFGTKNLADIAKEYEIEEFVMVSTDKAVNPINTMGLSKRLDEIYVQSLAKNSKTKFVSVRFGNVLGSQGSCIPIFKNQLMAGEPITITHPDMRRYFMTIPEASQLIIQAGTMGKGGEIFILRMGEPVKIVDLVNDLITLSGLNKEDIKFSFVGLRPGEKLDEELIGRGEKVKMTPDEKILVLETKNNLSPEEISEGLRILKQYLDYGDMKNTIAQVKHMISIYS